jgi:hypothetical protein
MVHIQISSQAVMQIQIICHGSGSRSGPAVGVRHGPEFESGFKMITTDPDWQKIRDPDPESQPWQKAFKK